MVCPRLLISSATRELMTRWWRAGSSPAPNMWWMLRWGCRRETCRYTNKVHAKHLHSFFAAKSVCWFATTDAHVLVDIATGSLLCLPDPHRCSDGHRQGSGLALLLSMTCLSQPLKLSQQTMMLWNAQLDAFN